MAEPVVSSHTGNNADLIREACALYARPGSVIADVTFGKGAFWKKTDTSIYKVLSSDMHPRDGCMISADFSHLPYSNSSIDIVVLDPPYIHNPGNHMTDIRYHNAATTSGMYHNDIMNLYKSGMREARRVLRSQGGQLWVKCKDQVESGVQRWSHIELYNIAIELEMFARDMFVLVPSSRTSFGRWEKQIHARKVHSYLWVFENPIKNYKSALKRANIFR